MNCEKCKFWSGEEYQGFRTCEQPFAEIGYSMEPSRMPNNGLLIEGDEGWGWYVGPKFGCVNFEAV